VSSRKQESVASQMNEIDRLTSILTMSRRGRSAYTSNPILDYSCHAQRKVAELSPENGDVSTTYDDSPYGGAYDVTG